VPEGDISGAIIHARLRHRRTPPFKSKGVAAAGSRSNKIATAKGAHFRVGGDVV
jgi:hypothetical protein